MALPEQHTRAPSDDPHDVQPPCPRRPYLVPRTSAGTRAPYKYIFACAFLAPQREDGDPKKRKRHERRRGGGISGQNEGRPECLTRPCPTSSRSFCEPDNQSATLRGRKTSPLASAIRSCPCMCISAWFTSSLAVEAAIDQPHQPAALRARCRHDGALGAAVHERLDANPVDLQKGKGADERSARTHAPLSVPLSSLGPPRPPLSRNSWRVLLVDIMICWVRQGWRRYARQPVSALSYSSQ